MPPVSTTYKNPTGKNNVLVSFNKWLITNIPSAGASDFTYDFMNQQQNIKMPSVQVSEFQYFDPGNSALGMVVFPRSAYPLATPATQGTQMETMLQIDIKTDQGTDKNAKESAYRIRDRFKRGLMLAGYSDDVTDTVIVPPIAVLDYDNASADTGIVARVPVEQDNAIQEKYMPPDGSAQNIHTIQLLVRLQWFELN